MNSKCTIESCIKEMVDVKVLNENDQVLLESILDKAAGISSPDDVKNFMAKNEQNIAQAEQKLNGRQKTWFRKACDFIGYAIDKGMSFISKHWLTILKLIAIIMIGMWAKQLYPLVSNTIQKLFDANKNIGKAVKAANADIQAHSKQLDNLEKNVNDVVAATSGGNDQLKDKMMKKVGDALSKTGIEGAKEDLSDPMKLRKSTSSAGGFSVIRENNKQYTKKQIMEAIAYWEKQLNHGNYKKMNEGQGPKPRSESKKYSEDGFNFIVTVTIGKRKPRRGEGPSWVPFKSRTIKWVDDPTGRFSGRLYNDLGRIVLEPDFDGWSEKQWSEQSGFPFEKLQDFYDAAEKVLQKSKNDF